MEREEVERQRLRAEILRGTWGLFGVLSIGSNESMCNDTVNYRSLAHPSRNYREGSEKSRFSPKSLRSRGGSELF